MGTQVQLNGSTENTLRQKHKRAVTSTHTR